MQTNASGYTIKTFDVQKSQAATYSNGESRWYLRPNTLINRQGNERAQHVHVRIVSNTRATPDGEAAGQERVAAAADRGATGEDGAKK